MRAITLLVIVWGLAFAGALADYALGTNTGTKNIAQGIGQKLNTANFTISGDPLSFTINAVKTFFAFLYDVLRYGLLLGTLAQAMAPWQLPDIFTWGLNTFSLFINTVFLIEFITGRVIEQ